MRRSLEENPKGGNRMQTSRGRQVHKPRPVYEPPEDFADDDPSEGEDLAESEEEEEEDEDTDLSGFIVKDGEEESDADYVPDSGEEEDTDDDEEDATTVTRDNLIGRILGFIRDRGLQGERAETAQVLASMVAEGYKFPFLKESWQLRLLPFYCDGTRPDAELIKAAFEL